MEKDKLITMIFLSSMLGSLIAFVVFACFAIIAGVPIINSVVMHGTETIRNEFNSSVIECSKEYRQNSMNVNINGELLYCTLRPHMPGAPIDLNNNFSIQK